jgi:hypothetical protein
MGVNKVISGEMWTERGLENVTVVRRDWMTNP